MRDGELYVLRELYRRGLDTAELIRLAEEQMFDKSLVMYCDAAEPDRIKTWRKAGFRAVPAKKGAGSVSAQIDFLRSHRLRISEECENLIRELGEWRWLKDPVSGALLDVPAQSSDDAIAALRYSAEHFREVSRSFDKSCLGL